METYKSMKKILFIIAILFSQLILGQTIGANQIKKDGVTIGANASNQLVVLGGGTNPTSGFIPYNNAGTFSDSWWSQDADYSILSSSKKIKGSASASNISLNTTFGAGSVGMSANAVSFDKGWSYVSSLGASSGFGATTYHAINLTEYAIVNPTKIRLAGPIINFANAPPYITTSDTTNYKTLFRNTTTGDIGWGAITGGSSQTLAQTLVFGNSTGGTSIVSPNGKSLLNIQDGLAQLQYVDGADEGGFSISPTSTYILNLNTITFDAPAINISQPPPFITTSDTTNYKILYRDATTGNIGWGKSTVSGIVPVANGGTGLTTFGGTNRLLYTTTTDNISAITTANTSVLTTDGSGVPSWTAQATAFNKAFGTGATDVCVGNDARLSDSRNSKLAAYSNTDVTHTGNTSETYLMGLLVPSLTTNSCIEIQAQVGKVGVVGFGQFRMYYNTTNDMSGSPVQIGANSLGAANVYGVFERKIVNKNSLTVNSVFNATTNIATDRANSGNARTDLNVDLSGKYIIITVQNASALDVSRLDNFNLTIKNP